MNKTTNAGKAAAPSFDDEFASLCKRARKIATWAVQRVGGKVGGIGLRYHLAGTAWANTVDLYMGMTMLAEQKLYSAALTLGRPIVESYAIGFWLMHLATEKELENFEKNYTIPALKSIKALLKKVAAHPASRIEDDGLDELARLLNSLTHGDHKLLGLRREISDTRPRAIVRGVSGVLKLAVWIVGMAVEDMVSTIQGEPEAVPKLREEWLAINPEFAVALILSCPAKDRDLNFCGLKTL
jgi:hypothetical protein